MRTVHRWRLLVIAWLSGVGCGPSERKDSSSQPSAPEADSGRANRPPSAPRVAIEPADPVAGDALGVRVVEPSQDPDGDALTWEISWTVDGVPATEWTDTVPGDVTAKGQVWELRASVRDDQFSSDTALDVVVIGNTLPDATVELQPETPTTLDTLRATPSGTDVDGDPIGYSLVWLVNGENTGRTELDVPAEATSAGETWTVVVTPSDPGGRGAAVTASVVVVNTVPTVASISIAPHEPRTLDTLQAVYEGTDPDPDDALEPRYTWTVDGVVVSTEAELDSNRFVRGQEVGLSIALDDGMVEGPPRFAEPVVVENTPAEVANAVLSPAAPSPTDTVTCSGVGWVDPDGDPESYDHIWSLDGMAGPSTDHWHLAGESLLGGEQISCTLVPNDGHHLGASVTVSATISMP